MLLLSQLTAGVSRLPPLLLLSLPLVLFLPPLLPLLLPLLDTLSHKWRATTVCLAPLGGWEGVRAVGREGSH